MKREGINISILITKENLSTAWLKAINFLLKQQNSKCNNLVVHIKNPCLTVPSIDKLYNSFCKKHNIPKYLTVAQFIFPQRLYEIYHGDRQKLFQKYKKVHEIVKGSWGSYFDQMVEWKESNGNKINQLDNIIKKILLRERVWKAAYTIQIANPILHNNRTMGGPCLIYILIQLESNPKKMSILSIYRNHDFATRAYGNYLGLGYLLRFLSKETGFEMDTLTCVSSHAFIENKYRKDLKKLLDEVEECHSTN